MIVCEFVNAQIPGTPVLMRSTPQVYTYSVALSNVSTANVTGQIFTNGQPIAETGVVWGTSPTLTIESATGTTTVNIFSGTPSATITGLSAGSIYYVALYAKTSSNVTLIGNSVEYEHGTVTTSTGRKWLQWNLGATSYPPSVFNDSDNYGTLYQWGRNTDGSQYNSATTLSSTQFITTALKTYNDFTNMGTPQNSKFVKVYSADWFTPSYDGLWQGVNGINNPCPSGYRLPTADEFTAEKTALNITSTATAFSSTLKLTSRGYRWPDGSPGPAVTAAGTGYYWTSNVVNPASASTSTLASHFRTSGLINNTFTKNLGLAVRCIQDDVSLNSSVNSSGGTAKVASYSCPSSGYSGSIYPVPSPALGADDAGNRGSTTAKQTITANVTAAGTYSLSAYSNGVTFAGNGTFAGTGSQTIELTASGTTKNVAGNYFIALQNVSPGCDFNAPVYSNTSGGSAVITWNIAQTGTGAPTSAQAAENNRDLIANVESSTYSPPFIHYRRVNVTTAGSYNIDVPSNRDGNSLRLVGSGTFSTTGPQIMTLYLIGAPTNWGSRANHYFYLPYPSHTPIANLGEIIRFSQ